MDAVDRQILAILQKDARISLRELGRRIAMSSTATAERVKKLEDAGLIRGYRAVVDLQLQGRPIHAFVMLECNLQLRRDPAPLHRYIASVEDIVMACPVLTGGVDFYVELFCTDTQRLMQLQQSLSQFGSTTTYMASRDLIVYPEDNLGKR